MYQLAFHCFVITGIVIRLINNWVIFVTNGQVKGHLRHWVIVINGCHFQFSFIVYTGHSSIITSQLASILVFIFVWIYFNNGFQYLFLHFFITILFTQVHFINNVLFQSGHNTHNITTTGSLVIKVISSGTVSFLSQNN